MFKYLIENSPKLHGNISISGSKNSSLPILAACLLTDEFIQLSNCPHVSDILLTLNMLNQIGVNVSFSQYENGELLINLQSHQNVKTVCSYDFVKQMRASILMLGPMLAKFGEAEISLPGGCAIGVRPVDRHIKALEKMGAVIKIKNGYLNAHVSNGKLKGTDITFDDITVGGTENVLMAACLAEGETIIHNAAIEPEIIHLIDFLIAMGAKITGKGTHKITIQGVKSLNGIKYSIPTDRIQAYTYAIISAATGFGITLSNTSKNDFTGTENVLEQIGIGLEQIGDKLHIKQIKDDLYSANFTTAPMPGFPTDCQAQTMALLTVVNGVSIVSEGIFENRMMHVAELLRMGADIKLNGHTAIVTGIKNLNGAEVMATDLRASASLVIAGLIAKGKTTINRIYHIERGYDFLPTKLEICGAKIKKIRE